MLIILTIYFILPLLVLRVPERVATYRPLLFVAVQLGTFSWFLLKLQEVLTHGPLQVTIEWFPAIGLNLSFELDALSMIFGLLVTGVGALVFLFSKPYMKSYEGKGRFSMHLFLFSGAMLGLVLASNLLLLFIFWELTTVLSYFLISFFNEKPTARKAAFQSLFITGFGGLALLAGIILLGAEVNSFLIADWISNRETLQNSPLYVPGLVLILLGVFTKSAQFPFHFWLPGAMEAPGPVSAYLHSATMVKAGFYLLARINPSLGGTPEWLYIVSGVGVVTMLVGSYFAVTQRDIKGILAYTTINALGVLVLLMGIDTRLSVKAALLFLFVHAFYKAALFMIAGMIEKKAGTRNIDELGGLRKHMPVTFIVTLFLVLSMAGLPPMLGFLGKELIYEAKLQLPGISGIVLVLGVISNIFMITVSMMFLQRIFLGKPGTYPKKPNEKEIFLVLGPAILAGISLFFGLFPRILGKTLIESSLSWIQTEYLEVKLKLWHGFNEVFFLSLFTIISGFLLFYIVKRTDGILSRWKVLNSKIFAIKPPDEIFQGMIDAVVKFSDRKTSILQHGYHRIYILSIILFAAIAIWFQVIYTWGWKPEATFSLQPFYVSGLVAVIIAATIFSAVTRSRVATIIALGVIGYGIALIYLYFSAIDLAITQVIVETLIVIMFVLVLQRLPKFARLSSRRTKLRDLLVALSFGSVMTVVAIKAIHVEMNHPISDYFLENSYVRAFGQNVVNVILVDFRALDTMGEVVVLAIAAVGVSLLFTLKKLKT